MARHAQCFMRVPRLILEIIMNRKSMYFVALALGSIAFSGTASAADKVAPPPPAADTLPYSDRDQMKVWTTEKDALEKSLKVGQPKDSYRQQLEKIGYHITSV